MAELNNDGLILTKMLATSSLFFSLRRSFGLFLIRIQIQDQDPDSNPDPNPKLIKDRIRIRNRIRNKSFGSATLQKHVDPEHWLADIINYLPTVLVIDWQDGENDELFISMVDDTTERKVTIPAAFLLGKNG